ncbi:hypothetical protein [Brevundimonas sp. SL161]|uniref:hypothetical protein n=1 Tax=Brevundimonas sp. SL161 TaxID=2804613 RepID=UPI003CF3325F
MARPALASETLAELGVQIFGPDWAASMGRLTGINARTLLRVKASAAAGEEYPAARGALAELVTALNRVAGLARSEADRLGVSLRSHES